MAASHGGKSWRQVMATSHGDKVAPTLCSAFTLRVAFTTDELFTAGPVLTLRWPGTVPPSPPPPSHQADGRRNRRAVRHPSMNSDLVLKHGGRSENDYDVVSGSFVVGRIFRPNAGVPKEKPWVWLVFFEHRKPGRPYKGHAVDREGALAEFAEAWRGR